MSVQRSTTLEPRIVPTYLQKWSDRRLLEPVLYYDYDTEQTQKEVVFDGPFELFVATPTRVRLRIPAARVLSSEDTSSSSKVIA